MKKSIKILMLTLIVLALLVPMVKATTHSELLDYLMKSHKIAGKDVSISEENKVKIKRYLSENTLTDEQATKIKAKVDEGIALMERAGVSDPAYLSVSDKVKLIDIGKDAAAVAGLTLVVDSNNDSIEIYKNGTLIESASTTPGKLVQTGTTHYSYVIIPSIAIIAVAVALVVRKKRVNA